MPVVLLIASIPGGGSSRARSLRGRMFEKAPLGSGMSWYGVRNGQPGSALRIGTIFEPPLKTSPSASELSQKSDVQRTWPTQPTPASKLEYLAPPKCAPWDSMDTVRMRPCTKALATCLAFRIRLGIGDASQMVSGSIHRMPNGTLCDSAP